MYVCIFIHYWYWINYDYIIILLSFNFCQVCSNVHYYYVFHEISWFFSLQKPLVMSSKKTLPFLASFSFLKKNEISCVWNHIIPHYSPPPTDRIHFNNMWFYRLDNLTTPTPCQPYIYLVYLAIVQVLNFYWCPYSGS